MDELHKFMFDGLPVRGALVRLDEAWQQILLRRQNDVTTGAYPEPVVKLLGEMTVAAVLMQSNIQFNGALVLQVFGDGPLKMTVVEVQSDLSFRATAKIVGDLPDNATMSEMVNAQGQGRCAITLDPQNRVPGQQPYQGVVAFEDASYQPLASFSEVIEHYMLQSEQLQTVLVLAADARVATGLLIQRLPQEGAANLAGPLGVAASDNTAAMDEHYNRIALLAKSVKPEELLTLDADTLLHRLFWQENVLRYPAQSPRFACNCSRERVAKMIHSLGREEAESILAERADIEVSCDFCGTPYRFDAVDTAQIFLAPHAIPPAQGEH